MNNGAVVVVGSHLPSVTFDVLNLPHPGETIMAKSRREPLDGGKGSNQAVAAARLGASVWFVGCVGADHLGESCREMLSDEGVNADYLRSVADVATGQGVTFLDSAAQPMMVCLIGANALLGSDEVVDAIRAIPEPKVVLTQLEASLESAVDSMRTAKEVGAFAIMNTAPAPESVESIYGVADLVIANETEAASLVDCPVHDVALGTDIAARVARVTGSVAAIVTLGGDGLTGWDAEGQFDVPAEAVLAVDASGAGDVFCAALATHIANGKSLRDAAHSASRTAGLSVTRNGVIDSFPFVNKVTGDISITRPFDERHEK